MGAGLHASPSPFDHDYRERLQTLKSQENEASEQVMRRQADESALLPAQLSIPDALKKKVPLHWNNFLEDAKAHLNQVTSKIYDGGVSKGLRHGQGQMIMPNGDVFRGHWKHDLRHGAGVCRFANGAIYKGEWREGRPHGNGLLYCPPGEIIEGRFDGWQVSDGRVQILFLNGEYYDGILKDNKRNTDGHMHYANGDVYNGEWFRDKRGGQRGKLTMANGAKLTGLFIMDQADGNAEFEDVEGNQFQTETDPQATQNASSRRQKDPMPTRKSRENLEKPTEED